MCYVKYAVAGSAGPTTSKNVVHSHAGHFLVQYPLSKAYKHNVYHMVAISTRGEHNQAQCIVTYVPVRRKT